MKTEIEVKFLNIDHSRMRRYLEAQGAQCIIQDRLMQRVLLDCDFLEQQRHLNKNSLRVRDEGDKVTITHKWFTSSEVDGAQEIEVDVSSFDTAVELLKSLGLVQVSFQESRRETWSLGGFEVALDVWPWLSPFMEIEGGSGPLLQQLAEVLGLPWSKAVFGNVNVAYRKQYPHLPQEWSIASLKEVKFDMPVPKIFQL